MNSPFEVEVILQAAREELASAQQATVSFQEGVKARQDLEAQGLAAYSSDELNWAATANAAQWGNVDDDFFWDDAAALPVHLPATLPTLVDCEWLGQRMQALGMDAKEQRPEGFHVLDCSWHLAEWNKDGHKEWSRRRIPGSKHFNLDSFRNEVGKPPSVQLPHIVPSEEAFNQVVEKLGISYNDTLVLYDQIGVFSVARVWWLFRLFGHTKVAIIDGGLAAYVEAASKGSLPMVATVDKGDEVHDIGKFDAALNRAMLCTADELAANIKSAHEQVLDCRPEPFFTGVQNDSGGMQGGHVPGAINVPFTFLTTGSGHLGHLHTKEELVRLFKKKNVDISPKGRSIIVYDNIGITAAILVLALETVGVPTNKIRVYAGTWFEWASQPAAEVQFGE